MSLHSNVRAIAVTGTTMALVLTHVRGHD